MENGYVRLPDAGAFEVYGTWSPAGLAAASVKGGAAPASLIPLLTPGDDPSALIAKAESRVFDRRPPTPVDWDADFAWRGFDAPDPPEPQIRRFVLIHRERRALRFLADFTEHPGGLPLSLKFTVPCAVAGFANDTDKEMRARTELCLRALESLGGTIPDAFPEAPCDPVTAKAARFPWMDSCRHFITEPVPLGGFFHTVAGWWLRIGDLGTLACNLEPVAGAASLDDFKAFAARAAKAERPDRVKDAVACGLSLEAALASVGRHNPADPARAIVSVLPYGYHIDADCFDGIYRGWGDKVALLSALSDDDSEAAAGMDRWLDSDRGVLSLLEMSYGRHGGAALAETLARRIDPAHLTLRARKFPHVANILTVKAANGNTTMEEGWEVLKAVFGAAGLDTDALGAPEATREWANDVGAAVKGLRVR